MIAKITIVGLNIPSLFLPCSTRVFTDVAMQILPPNTSKPFSRHPSTSYRKSADGKQQHKDLEPQLTAATVWQRPRFSNLNCLKQLYARPDIELIKKSTFS